jgi:hypothetical protein
MCHAIVVGFSSTINRSGCNHVKNSIGPWFVATDYEKLARLK